STSSLSRILRPPTSTLFPYTTLFRSAETIGVDDRHDREDLPRHVGAAGRRVVVCGVVQSLDGHHHGVLGRRPLAVELLQRAPREDRTRSDRVEPVALARTARHVVAEAPPDVAVGA